MEGCCPTERGNIERDKGKRRVEQKLEFGERSSKNTCICTRTPYHARILSEKKMLKEIAYGVLEEPNHEKRSNKGRNGKKEGNAYRKFRGVSMTFRSRLENAGDYYTSWVVFRR
jgi:hypothetical protein